MKCDETKPGCTNCQKQNEVCDYSIRLNWDGRGRKRKEEQGCGQLSFSGGVGDDTVNNMDSPRSSTFSMTPSSIQFETSPSHAQSGRIYSDSNGREHDGQLPPAPYMEGSHVDDLPELSNNGYGSSPEARQSDERIHSSLSPSDPVEFVLLPEPIRQSDNSRHLLLPQSYPFSFPDSSWISASPKSNRPTSIPLAGDAAHLQDGEISSNSSSLNRAYKRARHDDPIDSPSNTPEMPPPASLTRSTSSPFGGQHQTSLTSLPRPFSAGSLLTPASIYGEEGRKSLFHRLTTSGESADLRRLSVNSLLSDPSISHRSNNRYQTPKSSSDNQDWSIQYHDLYTDTTTYGVDRGFKDLDVGKNDDTNAISGLSPKVMRDHLAMVLNDDDTSIEFGYGTQPPCAEVDQAGYYDKPITISIPKLLEPLPGKLIENPMNLLVSQYISLVK